MVYYGIYSHTFKVHHGMVQKYYGKTMVYCSNYGITIVH